MPQDVFDDLRAVETYVERVSALHKVAEACRLLGLPPSAAPPPPLPSLLPCGALRPHRTTSLYLLPETKEPRPLSGFSARLHTYLAGLPNLAASRSSRRTVGSRLSLTARPKATGSHHRRRRRRRWSRHATRQHRSRWPCELACALWCDMHRTRETFFGVGGGGLTSCQNPAAGSVPCCTAMP